jgi:putative membrane protein
MPHKFLALAAGLTLAAGIGVAQKSEASRVAADNTFITKAAQGNMAEVEMGRLATQHATDAKVKQFGQRMIDDHSKANDELKKVASNKGATVPSTLDPTDQATLDRLSRLNGPDFDRTYMQDMTKDHRTDVAEFRREANRGQDPDVKAFASKTLPTLEDHLKMAESIQKEVSK